jgi:hypothetical protein
MVTYKIMLQYGKLISLYLSAVAAFQRTAKEEKKTL